MAQMRQVLHLLYLLLFLSLPLFSNEYFLLNEQKSTLLASLNSKILRAQHITIITTAFKVTSLAHSLEKVLSKGSSLTLIVTDLQNAAYYAKYKNSSVYVYKGKRPLKNFSLHIFIIDESDVCFSSLPFDEELLRRTIGTVTCSTDPEEIAYAKRLTILFTKRFKRY